YTVTKTADCHPCKVCVARVHVLISALGDIVFNLCSRSLHDLILYELRQVLKVPDFVACHLINQVAGSLNVFFEVIASVSSLILLCVVFRGDICHQLPPPKMAMVT